MVTMEDRPQLSDNKFILNSTTLGGKSCSKFFWITNISKTPTDIIYQITLDNIDENWIPTITNLLGDLRLYFKGRSGNAPNTSNYINWNSQVVINCI